MLASRDMPAFLENELRSSIETQRHWSSSSQTYAPAEVLMRRLAEGWTLSPIVGQEEHALSGRRRVHVYYFELCQGDRQMVMQVHDNPVVRRLIRQHALKVVLVNSNNETQPPPFHPHA